MANGDSERTEVLRGTLDLMVLRTLVSLGPSHGYAIAARIEQFPTAHSFSTWARSIPA